MSLRQIESRIDTITEDLSGMDRALLAAANRELNQLEQNLAGLRSLNPKRARIIENRIQSLRITLLARLATQVAKQRRLEAEAAERELRKQAEIAGESLSFAV